MRKKDFTLFVIFCPLFIVFTGCGEKLPDGMPPLYPATLLITQAGAPLAGATATLIDTTGNQQWYPGGLSDESGTIVLYTNGRYKGAPEGKYKVIVTKMETDPSKLGPAPGENDPKYDEYMDKLANEKRDTYTLIDKDFGDAKSTTLEVEIKKSSSEVPKLDVGKKVKIKISLIR
jgi:hypothetical protein